MLNLAFFLAALPGSFQAPPSDGPAASMAEVSRQRVTSDCAAAACVWVLPETVDADTAAVPAFVPINGWKMPDVRNPGS